MGLIQDKWNEGQCRNEDGIFFANDEYIPLFWTASGVEVGERQTIQNIVHEHSDGLCNFYANCECSNEAYLALGGGGSWEGEGFVALIEKMNHKLMWILHLQDLEDVDEIVIEGEFIKATATVYPRHNTLTISITQPQTVLFDFRYET